MEETKPVQVVMLDGDLTSPIMKNRVGNIGNIDSFPGELPMPKHLYFISTDLIKKHDYYLESRYEREPFIDEADDSWEDDETDSLFGKNPEGTFKVIATTDPSLGLPAIPLTWIRDVYVPSNGSIKTVRLSMEQYAVNTYGLSHDGEPDIDFRLKLTQDNEVVIVHEPNILEMTLKATTLSDDFVDQELEDAAKEWKNKLLFLDSSLEDIADMLVNSWKSGANWRAEQSANDTMEFAEWCNSTHYRYDPIYKTWRYYADSYTSKEFYELWQQSKKK